VPGPHLVYGLLMTAPNTIIEPIHPKATCDPDDGRGEEPPPASLRPAPRLMKKLARNRWKQQ